MWEAFEHAAFMKLDNLTAIIDVNRLGQRGETMHGWDLDSYTSRAEAFGWHTIAIDGHDVDAIDRAYAEAVETTGRPTVIVAKTIKGKGVAAVENKGGFHGKALDDPEAAIAELGGERNIRVEVRKPDAGAPHTFETAALELPRYEVGSEVATRKAYGEALTAVGGADGAVVALDGEVSNSTYAEIFAAAHPERYFEMYIAEQQMVAAAVGMQVRGWKPFASTFAAFFTRAYDFVRMAAVSRANFALCGSHAGVSIGEDGPSQMALEDLAMMRAVHSSTVLYPCDGNQTAKLVAVMADLDGIAYLRTTRAATPVIYRPDEDVRDRRQPGRALLGGGRGGDRGRRHHACTRRFEGRRRPRRRRGLGARASTATRSSPSTRRRWRTSCRGHRAAASSPWKTTGPRAGSARPCWLRSPSAERSAAGHRPRGPGHAGVGQAGRAARRRRNRRRPHRRRGPRARATRPRPSATSSEAAMAVVIASNLRKEIAGDPLFDGVSFKVERRDRLSLSGPERRRQDDAAADPDRGAPSRRRRPRLGEGNESGAARPAPAARP